MANEPADDGPKKDDLLDELKSVLEDGEKVGRDIAEQGRKRTEAGQTLADLARSAKNVLNELPQINPIPGIENPLETWRYYVSQGRTYRDAYSGHEYLLTSVSSTASNSTGTMFSNLLPALPMEVQEKANWAVADFYAVLGRTANEDKVLELMRDLGLDKPPHANRRSSAEQFAIAHDALKRPVSGDTDPANTSIIPMREAIQTAIDHLFAVRPNRLNILDAEGQNKTLRKITALACQLKKDDIPDNQVQSWARDWDELKNHVLSPSKTEPMNRDEWTRRLNRATVFLIGFLSGLDPQKMRRQ